MKYVFIHSLNKYSVGIYSMPRTLLGTGDIVMGKAKQVFVLRKLSN